jgi:hypothetical protein
MDANHHIWRVWAKTLHRWGLHEIIASLLDLAGPLTLFGAQAIYIGQPALQGFLPADQLRALAGVFEDQTQTDAFVAYLREENQA